MHEVAMALSVIRIVEEIGQENNLKRVEKINIRKGSLSGILEEAFSFAFDSLKGGKMGENKLLENAKIEFIHVEAMTECLTCHKQFTLQRDKKKCPFCAGEVLSYPFAYDFYVESIEGE